VWPPFSGGFRVLQDFITSPRRTGSGGRHGASPTEQREICIRACSGQTSSRDCKGLCAHRDGMHRPMRLLLILRFPSFCITVQKLTLSVMTVPREDLSHSCSHICSHIFSHICRRFRVNLSFFPIRMLPTDIPESFYST
jgi:hypothetical protein